MKRKTAIWGLVLMIMLGLAAGLVAGANASQGALDEVGAGAPLGIGETSMLVTGVVTDVVRPEDPTPEGAEGLDTSRLFFARVPGFAPGWYMMPEGSKLTVDDILVTGVAMEMSGDSYIEGTTIGTPVSVEVVGTALRGVIAASDPDSVTLEGEEPVFVLTDETVRWETQLEPGEKVDLVYGPDGVTLLLVAGVEEDA